MGKKVKAPKVPNFDASYDKDLKASKESWNAGLQASRPTQNGLFGSMTWDKDANGNWTQNETLNAPTQKIFNSQQSNQQMIADKAGEAIGGLDTSQINFDGAHKAPEVGGYNQQVIDTLRQLQAPELSRQRSAKEAQLAAMGLGTGSGAAYNEQQNLIGQNENDADLKSILAGINQGNTEFNQGMQRREADINEITGVREANLTQAGALERMQNDITGSGVSDVQAVGGYDTPSALEAMKAAYGANLNSTNARNATSGNRKSGLMGLASAGASIF